MSSTFYPHTHTHIHNRVRKYTYKHTHSVISQFRKYLIKMSCVREGRVLSLHFMFTVYAIKCRQKTTRLVTSGNDPNLSREIRIYSPVQQIGDRVRVLCQRCGEQHALVELAAPSQEFVHVRPFQNVHLMDRTVDFDRHHEIRVVYGLKINKYTIN